MTMLAGIFLTVFGAAGTWFLFKRFPHAYCLRSGYALMAVGGFAFVAWTLSKVLVLGIAATALLAVGAIVGIVGALRKELRVLD
jgi:hypothetical protein